MTIAAVRMYFWPSPQRQRLQPYLNITQGGFEEWFKRRHKPRANARRDAAPALREARYLKNRS